ncbi:unnamed protein product [Rhizophagus irregularis]|nr:unnamed protein product [Rhizophagus irregularis]
MSNYFRENVLPCKTNSSTLFMADDDFEMPNIDAALLKTLCNNLDLMSVDQVENTVLPEHDSDVVPHSPSSFCVTKNREIAINGKCCSVNSSKLEYTCYSEKISNLIRDPSPNQ